MHVLGVGVDADLLSRWRGWLAPEVQPFFVTSDLRLPRGAVDVGSFGLELGHTYKTWGIDRSLDIVWLDESGFFALSRSIRGELVRSQARCGRGAVPTVRRWRDSLDVETLRTQADGHRFVWWPSLLNKAPHQILKRVVLNSPDGAAPDALPSSHRSVTDQTWNDCADILPRARDLAGSFANGSGPNCFGTVMGASGVESAAEVEMLEEPFLKWLASQCRPGGNDMEAGTVLLWREREQPTHAAVTLGSGWALEKPSGEWWTPRVVTNVRDIVRSRRSPGQRLERHHIRRRARLP